MQMLCRSINSAFKNMATTVQFYTTKPLPIGVEVFGIDLNKPLKEDVIKQIKSDVTKYRIMVFRNQGKVDGHKHVEISRWFGDIDNTAYAKHPASPSIDIFRVSNDSSEGCTGVGMTGWHIDGSFRECPYAYSIYHMVSPALNGGNTMFIPLTELIEKLPADTRRKWERLWMISDRRGNICHPLIYSHPKTGRPTLCFHQGMTDGFMQDYNEWINNGKKNTPKLLNLEENDAVKRELQRAIDDTAVYSHKWQQEGDFVISDNLAVGHQAGPISSSLKQAGLRILHRVTVMGTVAPSKQYNFPFESDYAY